MLFDGQYGGIVYSQTHHKMSEQGKLRHTLRGREDGFIVGEGVVQNTDGTYSPNTTQVNLATYYGDYYRRANVESNSFDASFVKLREMRVEYAVPARILSRTSIRGASIAFYGRDLACGASSLFLIRKLLHSTALRFSRCGNGSIANTTDFRC
ncbi:hypothetical protein [Algoriphagus boritolerans]|uniref:hypothetical protein n=1 Tax=Algoriphagus boritolerans TaxID=308111 RepID=UPI000AF0EA8B